MAFEPEEILPEVVKAAKIEAKRNDPHDVSTWNKDPEDLPEYYPGYNQRIQNHADILVHSQKGTFPERLFKEKSPTESDEEFKYRKKNYKADFTVFSDFNNIVQRIFSRGNWDIDYDEVPRSFGDDTFQNYVESKLVGSLSLERYMRNFIPPTKIKDADGVIAVRPLDIETDEDKNIITTELLNPIPIYYSVEKIIEYQEGSHALILSDKKSVLKDNKEGLIFEFYDRENIWFFEQVGKKEDYEFKAILYFNHVWGNLPVIKLMGVPDVETPERLFYDSLFLFAVDHLDEATGDASNLLMAKNKSVYPIRVMIDDDCEFQTKIGETFVQCNRGILEDAETGEYAGSCSSCNGSGKVSRSGPLKDFIVKPKNLENPEGEVNSVNDAMTYVAPDTQVLEFLVKEIDRSRDAARKTLNILSESFSTSGDIDVTATETTQREKNLKSFLSEFAEQTFTIYQFILDAIAWMRYMEDRLATLIKPVDYDFTTEEDFVDQIKKLNESGADPFVVKMKIMRMLRTIFFVDEGNRQVLTLMLKADRLLGISNEFIVRKRATGAIALWEEILHDSSLELISELKNDDPNLFEKDIEDQVKALQDLARQKAQQIPSTTRTPEDISNQILNAVENGNGQAAN